MNLELDEPNCRCRRCRVDGDLSAVPVPLVPLSSPSRSDLSKNTNLVSPRRFAGKADNDHHHLHCETPRNFTMSLLQDVLRTQTLDSLDKALASGRNSPDDDDELVNVVSRYFCARWFSPRFSQLVHNLPYHSSRCLSPAVLEGRALARGQRLAPTRPLAVPGLALSIRFPP